MKDRFKFRVWLKYNEIMSNISSFCFLEAFNKCVFHFDNGTQKTLTTKDYILMQSTGLKDKNGKLIYEGDIVKCSAWDLRPTDDPYGEDELVEEIGIVKYELTKSAFIVAYGLDSTYDIMLPECHYVLGCSKATKEVIGNIYENPELLESVKE